MTYAWCNMLGVTCALYNLCTCCALCACTHTCYEYKYSTHNNVPTHTHTHTHTPQGQPIKDIESYGCTPWPDMQDLITHCLGYSPNDRPSAQAIFDRMCNAEFVCLKRAISVEWDHPVETFAVGVNGGGTAMRYITWPVKWETVV